MTIHTIKQMSEEEIAHKLQLLGFKHICHQEPTSEELEPLDLGNGLEYPVELADYVWKRDSDREFVVISISQCLNDAYKSIIDIDVSDAIYDAIMNS